MPLSDIGYLDIEALESAGEPEYHDVMTITLQEIMDTQGLSDELLRRWASFDAFDETQRSRLWSKFRGRFDWREIGILPIRRWLDRLVAKLNEVMPKYKPLYQVIADGATPLTDWDEYHKGRDVYSTFPQTALGGSNQDYATSGNDREYETVREIGLLALAEKIKSYNDVDVMVLDELEPLFSCLMSTTIAYM